MDGQSFKHHCEEWRAHARDLRDRATAEHSHGPLVSDLLDTLWSAQLLLELATAAALPASGRRGADRHGGTMR